MVVVISKRWVNLSQRQKMTAKNVKIEVKNIDHLGLVAGIIDEMGLVDIINELVGIERGEIVSAGVVVKEIILNGLGFVSRPLYLFPQFFEDKATEHLLGKGIKPEHLNDDKIGRVMDKLYVQGTRNVFMSIALAAVKKYGIETKNLHLDSTSFCLEGKYEYQDNGWSINIAEKGSINQEQYQGKQPLKVGFGYSRDRRPDLKQFIVDLVVSGDSNIPLFFRSADGNKSDKAVFGKIIASLKSEIDLDSIWVADSALYSQGNLQLIKDVKWITRVPLSIKEAQDLVTTVDPQELVKSQVNGEHPILEKTLPNKRHDKGFSFL